MQGIKETSECEGGEVTTLLSLPFLELASGQIVNDDVTAYSPPLQFPSWMKGRWPPPPPFFLDPLFRADQSNAVMHIPFA